MAGEKDIGEGRTSKGKSFATDLSKESSLQDEKTAGHNNKGKKANSKETGGGGDGQVVVERNGVVVEDYGALLLPSKKKSKGKKGASDAGSISSGFGLSGDGDVENNDVPVARDGLDSGSEGEVENSDQKKPVKAKKGGAKVSFSIGAFGDAVDSLIEFSCKKKPSKSKKGVVSAFTAFDGIGGSMVEKPSKAVQKGKCSNDVVLEHVSSFNSHDNMEEKEVVDIKEKDGDTASITFTGMKKSSKASKKKTTDMHLNEELDNNDDVLLSEAGSDAAGDHTIAQEDNTSVAFSDNKKKPSEKQPISVSGAADSSLGGSSASPIETDDAKRTQAAAEELVEVSKNKKKKSVRTAQEEEDFDKILAELGEGPPTLKQFSAHVPAVPPLSEKALLQSELEDGAGVKEDKEQGIVESAAAKKKKKKKEKDKAKKAAAAGPIADEKQEEVNTSEAKGRVLDKKVPKHVREIQEKLAKLKKAEERKKMEEEEKLRKEEEEQRRQDELERLADEKKRLKKEKEKEKIRKKKLEGKYLTNKQKEEARRLEAMKKQILANAGCLLLPSGDTGGSPTKRPKYQTKKSKPQSHANGGAAVSPIESIEESVESQCHVPSDVDFIVRGKDDELQNVEGPQEHDAVDEAGVEGDGEEEEDDDEEWDAKSWDDATNLKLPGKSAFAEEESDAEPEPVVQKEVKSARQVKSDVGPCGTKPTVGKKLSPSGPAKSHNVDHTKNTPEKLRSPICCIVGHVDSGKTSLLDRIRGTKVQKGEAGGITQQIGATYIPVENILDRTKELELKAEEKPNVPGLLVIDTPGHEAFANLRSRGSDLCDIAILVVDIMDGRLKPQTIESLNLLKMRNKEFIIALNKVDKINGWEPIGNAPILKTIADQPKNAIVHFNSMVSQVVTQFKEQGVNSELYYEINEDDMWETVSIVPTSASSGEGVTDLLFLLAQKKITYNNEVQCTVLEVKVTEGHGTTIDVILVNGALHVEDQIVVCGMQGPIVTSIRSLLTPHPMRESRVKGTDVPREEIEAAHGIKIAAQGLEHAVAGTALYVVGPNDDLDSIKETVMEDMKSVMSRIDKSGEGVYVQASTLGSLEALLEFLKTPVVNIPVSGIGMGPVHKKDIVKASVMLEKKKKEYATILAFDVRVTSEAKELADELGVKIFCADVIYHLFDQFKAYIHNLKDEKKRETSEEAVFPCVLKIIPNNVFNKKDPIILGVEVLEGIAKVGTPICVPQKESIEIGRIASIENNHKSVNFAKKGQTVVLKIVGSNSEEQQMMFGRHFEFEDKLYSRISRRSIDILKEKYRNELSIKEWRLVVKLKSKFKIQ